MVETNTVLPREIVYGIIFLHTQRLNDRYLLKLQVCHILFMNSFSIHAELCRAASFRVFLAISMALNLKEILYALYFSFNISLHQVQSCRLMIYHVAANHTSMFI